MCRMCFEASARRELKTSLSIMNIVRVRIKVLVQNFLIRPDLTAADNMEQEQ
jgi:hypothetical protein